MGLRRSEVPRDDRWFQSLAKKGYLPTLQVAGGGKVGRQPDNYGAGKYAMVTEGSWNTKT
ncbi:hypothetical protein AB0F52_16590 [Amycolatopsis sp. NPDC024027]|uniref:hypothetical protein n=1 Tax=Amycolatopsis sp. NPDC024027 TaxID=3154327 RepID=UPI0033F961A6